MNTNKIGARSLTTAEARLILPAYDQVYTQIERFRAEKEVNSEALSQKTNNIGIIGTGIFGTALALTAARAGNNVLCQARDKNVAASINLQHRNAKYLPDTPLPPTIRATQEISEAMDFAEVILLTVSAQATRSVLQQMRPFVKKDTIIVLLRQRN